METRKFRMSPFAAALLGAAVVGIPMTALTALDAVQDRDSSPVVAAASTTDDAAQTRSGRVASAATPTVPTALPDIVSIVKRYGPAVVNVSVRGTVRTAGLPQMPEFDEDSPFAPFFRQFPRPEQREVPTRGEGSGFIISKDGVILTNAHVVAGAKEVTVKLTDRREFTARVLGVDETSDVAVLKVDAKNLPAVRLGNPAEVEVGEWVIAIGAPFGFENTVTQGIVSAKGRSLPDSGYVPFLQTDVAVNPGNSGGPLFNLEGEVIGINSQIYSRSGGYQGVSFAIPIDVATNVSEQLQATGRVTRGKLGVTVQPVNQALADTFGLDRPIGALVSSVEEDSPAEKGGMEVGDVIIEVNGVRVNESGELPARIASMKPGSRAEIKVWRDKREKTLQVKVGELETQVASLDSPDREGGKLGISVRPLTAEERERAETSGLVIERVTGAALDAGLRRGDIVISANGKKVETVDDLQDIVSDADEHVALLVQRGNGRLFVPVDVG